jgi:hypothetical protein
VRLHDNPRRKAEWRVLHDRITETLDRFGKKDALRRGDYWLVDKDRGGYCQKLDFQNLSLFQPHVIKLLQGLLAGCPEWEIVVSADVVGTEKEWPPMTLIIQDDKITDDLKREFLPEEFRNISYEGARPPLKADIYTASTGVEMTLLWNEEEYVQAKAFLTNMGAATGNAAAVGKPEFFYLENQQQLDALMEFNHELRKRRRKSP